MLSPSLPSLLERVRIAFGLEVEVLDSRLQLVYPEVATALGRLLEESPGVRQLLLDALADGRPERLVNAGGHYHVFPLRRGDNHRQSLGLVAVRCTGREVDPAGDEKAWSELARAVVQGDFAATEALGNERQHSRRLLATLRFLRHLVETDEEGDLGHAILQAAAVWFDVDARIFQRDLAGEFVLHAALPGAHVEDGARRLNPEWFGTLDAVRLGPIPEWGEAAAGSEIMLVPLSVNADPEWVLALIGTFPPDAEALLAVLGRVAGAQLETIRARRRDHVRERFEALAAQGGGGSELVAVRLVRELMDMTGAAQGSLVLNRGGRERRLVSIGESDQVPVPDTDTRGPWRFAPTGFVCPMPLGEGVSATLELRPLAAGVLTTKAELVTRIAARVMRCWLVGAERSLTDLTIETVTHVSEFLRRIEEELDRAKRFDLRLSLV